MSRTRLVWFGCAALALVTLVAVGVLAGRLVSDWLGFGTTRTWNTAALLRQVQSLSQLVTVKYVMEKVIVVEDVKWYGESRLLMVAHGAVNAGINLAELQLGDLQVSGNTIRLRLPEPRITDAYLDDNETKIIERTTGLLRTFDKGLEQSARQQAVADLRRAARNGGILREAEQRAHEQVRMLFSQLGYEVEFAKP
jgi:hypothetical protein